MAKRAARKNRAPAAPAARQNAGTAPAAPEAGQYGQDRTEGGTVKGRVLWLLAAVLIVSGYALLHKVDAGGQNAWAIASPALLLCGYLLIIPAIVFTYRA